MRPGLGLWRPRDLASHTCVPPDANALELFKNTKSKVVTRYIRVCVLKTRFGQGLHAVQSPLGS